MKLADDAGGTENNIPYDIEFLDGVFTHFAIVDNPRYERANIVFNSKTVVQNYNQNQPRVPKGNPNGGQFTKNIIDLTNYFTSTPTMKEVKEFLNKMVEEGKEFATSSPDWFVDIPSSSRKKDHIAKSSQFQRMNKSQKNRHNKYVMALEDLLVNAQYLNPSPNKKPLEKPNTQQYHYFTSEAKIGDKTYKILFDTEEYKGDSTIKPQTVHLYDVREVKNSSLSANVQPSVKNLKEESNNIITDNQEDFNPDMKKHEVVNDKWITIKPHGKDSDDYRRIKLEDGETPKEAIERVYGKRNNKKQEPEQQYSFESKKIVVPYREYKNNWEDSGKYYTRGDYNPKDKTIELSRPWFAEEFEKTFDNISKEVKEINQEFEKNKDEAIKSDKWEELAEETRKKLKNLKKHKNRHWNQ